MFGLLTGSGTCAHRKGRTFERAPLHERAIMPFDTLDRDSCAATATHFDAACGSGIAHCGAFIGRMIAKQRCDVTRIECIASAGWIDDRSEEHTSELQSRGLIS